MDLLGFLLFLYEIYDKGKTVQELLDAFTSTEREEIFFQMADAHLAAAREHARTIRFTGREGVLLAIGDLEQAYHIAMKGLPPRWKLALTIPAQKQAIKVYQLGCLVSLFQSACYSSLHFFECIEKCAQRAKNCFEEYVKLERSLRMDEITRGIPSYPLPNISAYLAIDKEKRELNERINTERRYLHEILSWLSHEREDTPSQLLL